MSHLYNLRQSIPHTRQRRHFEKIRPTRSTIGERRKPQPNGQPGYIRIDTVHQGDLDKQKGVYHINAVDEVTQFEVIFTVEKNQRALPCLCVACRQSSARLGTDPPACSAREVLEPFPFKLRGLHADNGSEYINKRVAELLEKLLNEFTKSRSRHSNDNALAESKNGAVVRGLPRPDRQGAAGGPACLPPPGRPDPEAAVRADPHPPSITSAKWRTASAPSARSGPGSWRRPSTAATDACFEVRADRLKPSTWPKRSSTGGWIENWREDRRPPNKFVDRLRGAGDSP